jgi:hypothetical protein
MRYLFNGNKLSSLLRVLLNDYFRILEGNFNGITNIFDSLPLQ